MKNFIIAVLSLLLVIIGFYAYSFEKEVIKLSIVNQSLTQIVKKSHQRDSIQRLHMEDCSFISKSQIEVGYDNYIRIKESTAYIASN